MRKKTIPCSTALMKHLPKLALNRALFFRPMLRRHELHSTVPRGLDILDQFSTVLTFTASTRSLQNSSYLFSLHHLPPSSDACLAFCHLPASPLLTHRLSSY